MPRALWWSQGGVLFLMSEVPLDVIRKEAWPFYRTISGVRLYSVLEEPKGPKGPVSGEQAHTPYRYM